MLFALKDEGGEGEFSEKNSANRIPPFHDVILIRFFSGIKEAWQTQATT